MSDTAKPARGVIVSYSREDGPITSAADASLVAMASRLVSGVPSAPTRIPALGELRDGAFPFGLPRVPPTAADPGTQRVATTALQLWRTNPERLLRLAAGWLLHEGPRRVAGTVLF